MPEAGACRHCGGRLSGGSGAGQLCFACLLAQALPEGRARTPWRAGSLLSFLQIVNVVADGPRGRVYLARWTLPDGGFAALKRGHVGLRAQPDREAGNLPLLELDHPHVATLFDLGQDGEGRPYAIVEYVPGSPLPAYWRRHDLLATERLELLRQTADALAYLHGRGMPHANLKPTNVLVLDPPVGVKLLDLDAVVPSPDPIPRRGNTALNAEPDIHALGTMLRSMIEETSTGAATDAGLRSIAERAMAASPRERYGTMQEMAADLTGCLAAAS
jgi:serine/threonine protein kinase